MPTLPFEWESGSPLDGVVAVVGLVLEGIPLAFGGVAAADVLHYDEIATRGGGEAEGSGIVLVVGRALKKRGIFAVTGGVVDVGVEGDAVAGLHGDAVFYGDVGVFARGRWGRGRGRSGFV